MVLIWVEFYSCDWGVEYKSFVYLICRMCFSNLFDVVCGKFGNMVIVFICVILKKFKLD